MRLAGSILALLLGACGYTAGFELPENARALSIEMFGNESKMRDIEADVHQHLSAALRSRVPARLVNSLDADLVLSGTVLVYERRNGIRSPQNRLLETGVLVEVSARLVRPARLDQPEVVLREVVVDEESGFRLDEPLGELEARERVLRRLADRLVIELFTPGLPAPVRPTGT